MSYYCDNKNNGNECGSFLKSTKINSPANSPGATGLPKSGDGFMYTETSLHNHGDNVFVSSERTDFIILVIIYFGVTDFQFYLILI